jgi:phosphoribosyl 1,2-cyclic phosphodiesterase
MALIHVMPRERRGSWPERRTIDHSIGTESRVIVTAKTVGLRRILRVTEGCRSRAGFPYKYFAISNLRILRRDFGVPGVFLPGHFPSPSDPQIQRFDGTIAGAVIVGTGNGSGAFLRPVENGVTPAR